MRDNAGSDLGSVFVVMDFDERTVFDGIVSEDCFFRCVTLADIEISQARGQYLRALLRARHTSVNLVMPPKKTKKGPVKWQFKIDLRKKNDDDDAWNDYDDKDSRRLEANYISYDDEFALNTTYAVDFTSMAQFRRDDRERERPIRRVDELGMPAYALADLPDVDVAAVKKLRKAPLKKAKNDDDADGDGVDDDDDDDGVVTTSTKSPTKKKSPAKAIAKKTLADDKLGVWQWENDDALWETYAEEDNDLIEKLHKAGVGKVTTDKFTFCAGYDTSICVP
jgi:hypothetical protein